MPFHAFTPEHAITSLIGLGLMLLIFRLGRKSHVWRNRMAAVLAFANLVAWRSLDEPVALEHLRFKLSRIGQA